MSATERRRGKLLLAVAVWLLPALLGGGVAADEPSTRTLSGRVVSPDGTPAVAAAVIVSAGDAGPEFALDPPTVRAHGRLVGTDIEGRFVLEGVPAGTVTVWAEHVTFGEGAKVVDGAAKEVEVVVGLGRRVRGDVDYDNGAPATGVKVLLERLDKAGGSGQWQESEFAGRFLFRWQSPGRYRLSVHKEGYEQVGGPWVIEHSGEGSPAFGVRIRKYRGEELFGYILGLSPAELEDAEVRAVLLEDSRSSRVSSKVDPQKRSFHLEGLVPGRWRLDAVERATGTSRSREIEIVEGGSPYRVNFELGGGFELRGVVKANGRPFAGATVRLEGLTVAMAPKVQVDLDGSYRLRGLEPGRYMLRVFFGAPLSFHQQEVTISGDHEIDLEVDSAHLEGRVRDVSRIGRTKGTVLVIEPIGRGPRGRELGITHITPEGEFLVSHLPPGLYRIASLRNGSPVASARIKLIAGEKRWIELARSAGIAFEIEVDLTATPDTRALEVVFATEAGDVTYAATVPVSSGGRVPLAWVPPGTWTLSVSGEHAAWAETRVEVPGPAPRLTLQPEARLEIEAPSLARTAYSHVTLERVAAETPSMITHEPVVLLAGKGALGKLLAGRWAVRVETPNGEILRAEVDLAHGETRLLEVGEGPAKR